jgi:2-polyprenyl-6-methoxyphenol hydroxylase-like FAD-dependent oxidoreductase
MATDLLIVGGGIGGLVLAELLGRGGKKVVVLERSTGPPPFSRPEVLWPATIELLCTLLSKSAWLAETAVPLAGVEIFNGHEFVWGISPAVLDRAGVHPWSTDPNRTREMLMRLGAFELNRGFEVQEVLKQGDRVIGARAREVATGTERQWLADVTVGDDGANSLVRAAAGIGIEPHVWPVDLLSFQAEIPAGFRADTGHIWPNLSQPESGILFAGMLPAAGGRGMGLFAARPRLTSDTPGARQAWQEFLPTDSTLAGLLADRSFPDEFQRFRRPWGHVSQYGGPGALLMGDAAHPVSPAGGQGANMSVADGRAIAELVLAGERKLLPAYERIRRPANSRSLRFTRGAAFVFGLPEWLLPTAALFWLVRRFGSRPALLARFIRTAATAFVSRRRR